MSDKRDIKLDQYNISKYAYRELYNFCMQYREKKDKLKDLYSLSLTPISGMPHGTSVGAPTENKAMLAARISSDCELIEQSVLAVGGMCYPWLLDGVTEEGCSFDVMNREEYYRGIIPVGKNKYYMMRRQFYWLLAIKRGIT